MPELRWLAALLAVALAACSQAAAAPPPLPLTAVKDIPVGPPSRRFDYASLDPVAGLLFFADLAGSRVMVVDVKGARLVKAVPDVASAHGVLAAPELGRVYASATGSHELVAIDEKTLAVTARSPAGRYPDGIAFDPKERKLYVSDEKGGQVAVIDAASHRLLKLIRMGGEVGNTQYDPGSGLIYSNAQGRGELVAIDPRTDEIVSREALPGCAGNHGLLIDAARRLAFIACEDNARLIELSLVTKARIGEDTVGGGPDVLAYDPGLRRLYVSSESGVVSVFQVGDGKVAKLGQGLLADNAHTVAVDPATHIVYFPLRNVDGRAIVRVMAPR
ncbi:MAG TPA: YncE family protein [Caulobacteraceae bacterium]|nr:YncE family protein [Caulobacteraceae bacterium]